MSRTLPGLLAALVVVSSLSPARSLAAGAPRRASRDAGLAPDAHVLSPAVSATPARDWWRDRVFYEVFVRSFADSDGDGIGDFKGLTGKLDYLRELGVDALWLMPINPSPSYHGYDVTDYRGINPQFGTMADFEEFLQQAHRRDLKVIIDFVLNHSSTQHPWFVSARTGPESPYRDFYSWSPTAKPWRRPDIGSQVWYQTPSGWYYGFFWGGMPDLNLGNPATEAEMTDVARFWLAKGVDGFRVDAARYLFESPDGKLADLPETHAFMRRMRATLQREFPKALFVAEGWTVTEDIATYYGAGDEYQMAFEFDLASAIIGSVKDGGKATFNQQLARMLATYQDQGFPAPFLTNHDQMRVRRFMGEDPKRARLAAAVLLAMPGSPFLYYGEEIGMQGGEEARDEDKRTPMRWTPTGPGFGFTTAPRTWYQRETGTLPTELPGVDVETQRADPGSLFRLYQRLLSLRRAEPALAAGKLELPAIEKPGRGTIAVLRTQAGSRVLFVANLHTEAAPPLVVRLEARKIRVLFQEGAVAQPTVEGGQLAIPPMGPQSFAFLALD